MSTKSVPSLKSLRAARPSHRRFHTDNPAHRHGSRHDEDEDYVNPLEGKSRWLLSARALAVRSGASLGFSLFHYSDPKAPPPTRTIWLDATLGKRRDREAIGVDVFDPLDSAKDRAEPGAGERLAVINFHGGGFILGSGRDDRHWVGSLNTSLEAIVFSVNYRLAPTYPYPTAVEDCADAILQICSRAEELRFDRVILSGFSAGGTLALASWLILQNPERWGYNLKQSVPSIDGMVLFYPGLDWSIPRPQKRAACTNPELTLPPSLTDLIDASYIYPPMSIAERRDVRLSPGLMTDEFMGMLPPIHLCLCEHDMLRPEGHRFANRLRSMGKEITARVVVDEKHAWDKPLPMLPKSSVLVEYTAAIAVIKGWTGHNGGVCGIQCSSDENTVPSEK